MNSKKIVLMMIAILMVSSVIPMIGIDGASDDKIIVKDGRGIEFVFDGPVDKVMTIGAGIAATAIGVGCLDKISVCDNYSYNNSDSIFDGLKQKVKEGKIAAGGNIYDSGAGQLKIDALNAADPKTGTFDREKDVVMVVVSPSYEKNVKFFEEEGFKNVMYWNTVSSFSEVCTFVETISKVCTGTITEEAEKSRYVFNYINETLTKAGVPKAEAFYVTYSSNVFKVGNTGSLATSMIEGAGGDAITKDPSKSTTTYETNLTELMDKHPDAIIFADNVVAKSTEHMKELKTLVGDDAKIYALEPIWNNFSIKSVEGLWAMASVMYPDYFHGDMPKPVSPTDDFLYYAIAGVISVLLICAIGFYYLRG